MTIDKIWKESDVTDYMTERDYRVVDVMSYFMEIELSCLSRRKIRWCFSETSGLGTVLEINSNIDVVTCGKVSSSLRREDLISKGDTGIRVTENR